MVIEDIKQELIGQGQDPEDFNITITENGYAITPKWFYEAKQIAKKEVEKETEQLKKENLLLKAQAKANADLSEFHEELIVELAMMVYQ